jgi:hypothetical protein
MAPAWSSLAYYREGPARLRSSRPARVVYREVGHLLVELDRALEIVSLAAAASE